MLAGMKSEQVAGFVSESMAGFIGIRKRSVCGKSPHQKTAEWCAPKYPSLSLSSLT
jgi:hypothetical protein